MFLQFCQCNHLQKTTPSWYASLRGVTRSVSSRVPLHSHYMHFFSILQYIFAKFTNYQKYKSTFKLPYVYQQRISRMVYVNQHPAHCDQPYHHYKNGRA
nr:MAG TPA: hypothetical protein [Caudoviricetes sp.]